MIKKVLHLCVLANVIGLNSPTYATDNTEEARLQACFPKCDITVMQRILQEEAPIVAVPVVSGTDVGFNMNHLIPLHYRILQQVQEKTVLEVGPGGGYMTAKILAAGAAHVDAIEYSAPASQQIPRAVQKYATALGVDLQSRLTITTGDVLSAKLEPQSYDCGVLLNVLHYQTPANVIKMLNVLNPSMKDGAPLYITMNAPSSESCFVETFKKEYQTSTYPGYMQKHRVDVQIYETNPSSGELVRLIKKEKTLYEGASPLSAEAPVSPMKMEVKGHTIVGRSASQATVHVKIDQPSFFGDTRTLKSILDATGYNFIESHYFDGTGNILPKLDFARAKNEIFALAIIATKRPTLVKP